MLVPRGAFAKALKALYDYLDTGPWNIRTSREVLNSAAQSQALNLGRYESVINLTGAGHPLTIGNGTGVKVGHRKLITVGTRAANATGVFDHANVRSAGAAATGVVFDAAGEFLLLEWRGDAWHAIAASAGVIST